MEMIKKSYIYEFYEKNKEIMKYQYIMSLSYKDKAIEYYCK